MLVDRRTGRKREVNVVLRATVARPETVIAVEATSGTQPAAVDWVEEMIGKHNNLPTDKLVLVSEAGFSKQARTLAEKATYSSPLLGSRSPPVGAGCALTRRSSMCRSRWSRRMRHSLPSL